MSDLLTDAEIAEHLAAPELAGWSVAGGALHARYRTGGFAAGLAFVDAIGAVAEELDHHPDLDLRFAAVVVHSTSHDRGGVTRRDVRLARRVATLAAERDLPVEPST